MEACAPEFVHCALIVNPGSICHTMYAPYNVPSTPNVSITLPTICTPGEETRVPSASMPLAYVAASASSAKPPTISNAMNTSVGRCHCPAITDNPTSEVYSQPITATGARSTRGTEHSNITLAAAARMA